METTFQTLYDKGLFDGFPYADEVVLDFLYVTRRRGDLDGSKWFCQWNKQLSSSFFFAEDGFCDT